jgi:Protein of unknown function (DUF4238)
LNPDDRKKVLDILKEADFSTEAEMKHAFEQSVEKFFSEKIEGNFQRYLDKIRSRFIILASPFDNEVLPQEECNHLAIFLAYQIVRSKEFRQTYSENKKAATQALVDIVASSYDEEYELGSITAAPKHEFQSLEHASIIFGEFPLQLAGILSSHIWFVGVNMTSYPFYTSDHSIVKWTHYNHPVLGTEGYGSEGIEVAIPLSKRLIVVLAERNYHQHLLGWEKRFIPMLDEQNIEQFY